MAIGIPFCPDRGANLVTTPAAGSASVAIRSNALSVRLVNSGANICHVRIGDGSQTATTADLPVRSGSEVVVSKADGDDTLAYISASGTTLHIQTGEGGA
jgi:hypothetical protein